MFIISIWGKNSRKKETQVYPCSAYYTQRNKQKHGSAHHSASEHNTQQYNTTIYKIKTSDNTTRNSPKTHNSTTQHPITLQH